MDATFWKNKKVLVTGHTGFKGSWLSLWLQTRGANVIGYSLEPPTAPSFFELGEIASEMVSLHGDIRDLENFKTAVKLHQPEIIIHMAAQSLVRYSYQHPVDTYSTNVMGTVNILDTVRQLGSVKVVLIITSDKCYENRETLLGYKESDPMGGYDPYSSSKGCAELVTAAYRNSFFSPARFSSHGVAIASTRAGNVIGGGDWGEDRLIPDIMRSTLADQPVVIRYPDAIRPWQHVLEPLNGYLQLAERLWDQGAKFTGGWNFGPDHDDCKPVHWILETLNQQWKGGIKWIQSSADNPHEATYLNLDCSKSKQLLGWSPKLDLGTALELLVDWYQGYANNVNLRELSMNQLAYYEKLT
jgi:CDP-glucose 4,6-dehydratase